MANLSTTFMGLKLKNPIIVGASGLTNNIHDIKDLATKGAGAIVLKSLFEEEIVFEMEQEQNRMTNVEFVYPETFDYMDIDQNEDKVRKYLSLIKEVKSSIDIPVIASINCVSDQKWIYLTKEIEKAGADGIELNLFILPSDINRSAEDNERLYMSVIEKVRKETALPIALKISYYFSNLAATIKKMSDLGVNALTLFNRFYSPDFNTQTLDIIPSSILSHQGEIYMPLRWIGIMSGRVSCDIASSTGVQTGDDAIKMLLAGATTVQVVSTLYRHGNSQLRSIIKEIEEWMDKHGFESVSDFRGKLAQSQTTNPAAYERVQFMKQFS